MLFHLAFWKETTLFRPHPLKGENSQPSETQVQSQGTLTLVQTDSTKHKQSRAIFSSGIQTKTYHTNPSWSLKKYGTPTDPERSSYISMKNYSSGLICHLHDECKFLPSYSWQASTVRNTQQDCPAPGALLPVECLCVA